MKLRSRRRAGLVFVVVALSAVAAVGYWRSRPIPLYGHLVFGPEAELRLRFIVHGLDIYWDRNADDVAQRSEFVGTAKMQEPITLGPSSGQARYTVSANLLRPPQAVNEARPQELDVHVAIRGPAQYDQYGGPILSSRRDKPGIAHFDGPLAIRLRMRELQLPAGPEPTLVRVEVSTYQPQLGGWAPVGSNGPGDRKWAPAFPAGVAPIVDIEFPAKARGAPAIKERFVLDHFC